MKALLGTNRELTSCLLCEVVGVGAGRQITLALLAADSGPTRVGEANPTRAPVLRATTPERMLDFPILFGL